VRWPDVLLLCAAGIGAGLSGSIAGLASLFSYPALLAVGLAPVTANVTNTVALVFGGAGSVVASRPEWRGQDRRRLGKLVSVATAGGLVGGLLLIHAPAGSFERVVPVLIALASVGVLVPRRRAADRAATGDPRWLVPSVFGVGIYGGYFGAAAGTMLLALFLVASADTFVNCNALKNIVLGAANGVAAVLFAVSAHVRWMMVVPLAFGLLIGGVCGPVVVRHAPVKPLRWLIALAGIGLAIHLGLQEYA
jgi:uncharacterized membrane protein YfcA